MTGLTVRIELFDGLDEIDAVPDVRKLIVVIGEDVDEPKPATAERLATLVAERIDVTDCIKLDVMMGDSVVLPIESVADVLIETLGLDDDVYE